MAVIDTLATLPWAGIYDTPPEVDAHVTDIEGAVPEGLVGALYRNGPGKLDVADHLFDGDGMVSRVEFRADGTIHFRNRFVRTHKYLAELRATRPKVGGFGTRAAGGVLKNALRRPSPKSNAANTNVMFSASRLLALYEAGHPWQLDPDTLETLGEMDFDGALEARLPFSAHPHWDPNTREIFNHGMVYGPKSAVATYRIDPQGRLHKIAETPLPANLYNHDFILTDRWLVFCLGPTRPDLVKLLSGRASFGDSLQFHPDEPTRVLLVARDGSETVTVEADAWFQFHFAGAFDDGDDVVVDLVRYPDFGNVNAHVKGFRTADFRGLTSPLWRLRISPKTATVDGQPITTHDVEFPQVDQRRATGGYRTVYAAFVPPEGGLFDGIGRIDTATGTADVHHFGPGHVVTEPLFVPRPGGTDEDDGWLVALVHDPDRRAGDAVVLDARRPGKGPVCTAHLPVNTGVSFHGIWRSAA